MTDYTHPSSDAVSEAITHLPCVDDRDDNDQKYEAVLRQVNVSNTFALMRAVVELRFLQTTTAILRITRTNPVSISDPKASIRRAIDRREHRISAIINRMTKEDPLRSNGSVKSRLLVQCVLSPSEILENMAAAEDDAGQDEEFLHISLSDESTSIPKLNILASEEAAAGRVDGDMKSGKKGIVGDENGRLPGQSPVSPPPTDDSVYSSLGRSLSANNVQSVDSGSRQCMVVSAAQYTKIVAEREPQFTLLSQPYSIDSLVAKSARLDRSALEINEHHQQKSADSFPGEFPVSEGLEFSALATAKHHSRVPSIRTSVRPFSDL
ncbi:hypothetical protein BJX99DRAFT_54033 [Aspergillus californicus]